jgi:hypothetical protein
MNLLYIFFNLNILGYIILYQVVIMLIGSIDIQKDNAVYVISNLTTCIEHPFFSSLFQSFDYFANTSSSSYSLCAKSIVSLDQFIQSTQFNITTATLFLHSIYYQIQNLLENNIAISFMDLNDIMVIDGDKFYFCNHNKLYNITQNKTIMVTDFYDPHNLFLPPEFIHNNMIPFSTHYTSVYYSLAIVIMFCLTNSNNPSHSSVYHNRKDQLAVGQGRQEQHQERQLAVGRQQEQQQERQLAVGRQQEQQQERQLAVGRLGRQQHTKLYNTLSQCMIEDPIRRKLFLF